MVYTTINQLLLQSNIEFSAAEAHGLASGMLCANRQTKSEYWLAELFQDGVSSTQQNSDFLIKFFNITRSTLEQDDFSFNLLLPDDNTELMQQAEALKLWCQGFLFGVGLVGKSALQHLHGGKEILKDIAEFTKLDSNVAGEEDEQALMEIVEYLRSAVLLLRDELINHTDHTLH